MYFLAFPWFFPLYKRNLSKFSFFSSLLIKRFNILHLLPKLCKISTNFNPILNNEITFAANCIFFTLATNCLKAIAENQGNPVEWSLVISIPTSLGNNCYCPVIFIISSQSSYRYYIGGPFFCYYPVVWNHSSFLWFKAKFCPDPLSCFFFFCVWHIQFLLWTVE